MKIHYWNAQGLSSKIDLVRAFIQVTDLDILLIGETHLKPHQKCKIFNYTIYRTDRLIEKGGGTAIIIRNGMKHDLLPNITTDGIEITSIKLYTKRGPLIVHSTYSAPSKKISEADMVKIFDTRTPTLLAGDLNAKHQAWNSRVTNSKGKALKQIGEHLRTIIDAPSEPTHIHVPTQTTDVLDLVILKNINVHYSLNVIDELSSDHLPIEISLDHEAETKHRTVQKTDWTLFKETFKVTPKHIQRKPDIEEAVNNLESSILTAMSANTKTRQIPKSKPLPTNIRVKLLEKRKLVREYARTLYPGTKTKLNNITNEIKSDLREHYNEQWTTKLKNLNTEDRSLWQVAKSLKNKNKREKIPPLKDGQNKLTTDIDKAEAFANALQNTFKPNPTAGNHHEFHQTLEKRLKNHYPTKDQEIRITTIEEIAEVVKKLKNRKAPGKDGIPNLALKHLPTEGLEEIVNITNAIFKLRHFPNTWKEAQIIMVPKANKPKNEVHGYRPISLLPTISKLVEKVIHNRLNEEITTRKLIPNFQFGFKPQHTTTHQLTRLTEYINTNMNLSTPTAAVFLDVEKAFDKVWHAGLLYKLRINRVNDNIIEIINSYLKDRKFRVKIEDDTSTPKTIAAGVPQGSILGPTLYNLFTQDIPRPTKAEIGLYADDTAIYYAHRNLTTLHKTLQKDLENTQNWFQKWRININVQKTQAVFFQHRRRPRRPNQLVINNHQTEWKTTATYLGVTLDDKLTYTHHVKKIKQKIGSLARELYPLLNVNSKLSIENKRTIINTILMPVATYAGEIWHQTTERQKQQMQSKINNIVRLAANAPKYLPNKTLFKELNLQTLETLINKRTLKTAEKTKTNENPEIRKLIQPARRINERKPGIQGIIQRAEEEIEKMDIEIN